jgi:hypothetical protein
MAGVDRLSKARISVGDEVVEIPWPSRFELLERLRAGPAGRDSFAGGAAARAGPVCAR